MKIIDELEKMTAGRLHKLWAIGTIFLMFAAYLTKSAVVFVLSFVWFIGVGHWFKNLRCKKCGLLLNRPPKGMGLRAAIRIIYVSDLCPHCGEKQDSQASQYSDKED